MISVTMIIIAYANLTDNHCIRRESVDYNNFQWYMSDTDYHWVFEKGHRKPNLKQFII